MRAATTRRTGHSRNICDGRTAARILPAEGIASRRECRSGRIALPNTIRPSHFVGVVKGVSAFVPSPSGRFGAYTVDTTTQEKFSLMVVKLPVAGGQPEVLASILQGTDVDVVWVQMIRNCFIAPWMRPAGRIGCIGWRLALEVVVEMRRRRRRRTLLGPSGGSGGSSSSKAEALKEEQRRPPEEQQQQ